MKRMKRILLLLLLLSAIGSYGQKFRVLVRPIDDTICDGGNVSFITDVIDSLATGTYTYKWLFNNLLIPDSSRSYLILKNLSPLDTGYYRCVITDTTVIRVDTSSPSHIVMRGQLHVDTLYRYNAFGCPTDSNGQEKIKVSGGNPPYTYVWSGGSFHQLDTLGVGFPKGDYTITVTDSDTSHCVTRQFKIEVLKLHKITFHFPPPDTIYLSNPGVTVTIPDSAVKHLDNWNWDFGDKTSKVPNVNPCEHNYSEIGEKFIRLNFTDNIDGQLCDSTVVDTIYVKTIKLFIPNAITPGTGDDNKSLNIRKSTPDGKPSGDNLDLSEIFLSNQMYIFDRWGKKVFEKVNYMSGDWDGGNLSSGVYYYILKCHGANGDEVYRGAVTIIRN